MGSILTRKVHGNCTNSSPMFSRGILTLVVRMWECQSHTSRQQSRSMTQSTAWALSYRHHGSPSCLKKCFCLGLGAGLCETDKGSLLTQHTSCHLLCVHVLTALLEIGRVGNLSPMMHKKYTISNHWSVALIISPYHHAYTFHDYPQLQQSIHP